MVTPALFSVSVKSLDSLLTVAGQLIQLVGRLRVTLAMPEVRAFSA